MAKKVCITPLQKEALDKAIAKGDFSLAKLQKTQSSKERFDLVNKFFDDSDVSKKVVRDIETRLSSKKEDIIKDYMERSFTDVPENTTKGVLNKFKRMSKFLGAKEEKDFLEEVVSHKFGAYLTKEEANKFEKLTNEAVALKDKIPENAEGITDESMDYGRKIIELENEEARVFMGKTALKFSDYKKFKGQRGAELISSWSKYLGSGAAELSGATRAFKATADVSGLLRQNWKIFSGSVGELALNTLKGEPTKTNVKWNIWKNSWKNTIRAVSETAKYGDHRFYDEIRAEIHAHPNSYNGVFDAASNSYGLRSGVEEQFPSSAPSDLYDKYVSKKNNVFKISEVAFNAVVLKARFELANETIDIMRGMGLNVMDKKYADPAGEFVSAFTGRGGLGLLEGGAKLFNKIFFAPKYAASQFSPYFQIAKGITTQADNKAARLAAVQNAQFLVGSAALLLFGETIRASVMGEDPDYTSVINPLSNSFGKVKTFDDRSIDLTGGNRSAWVLMSNLFSEKFYDNRLGIWRKKGFFQTVDGKAYYDFVSGKYAPVPAVLRDIKRGEHFGGKEISPESIVSNLLMPITVENVLEEGIDKGNWATATLVAMSELVGVGTTDIRFKPQNDEWSALLNTDSKAYWEAVDELWTNIQGDIENWRVDPAFQALPEDKQRDKLEKLYTREMDRVIHQEKYQNEEAKEKVKEAKEKRKEF